MATIITKNSSTASSVPTNAQLVQGELAVNVTDKRLFTENASGTVVELGTNPSSLTLPNGTANGLAFLNASKVLTTGSALTFDGTNLGIGTSSPASKLNVQADDTNTIARQLTISGATSSNKRLYIGFNTSTNVGTIQAYEEAFGKRDLVLQPDSGNLGLGVTPSAWGSVHRAIDIASGANGNAAISGFYSTSITRNAYFDGTNWKAKYTADERPAMYAQPYAGGHQWFNGNASVSAGGNISFTQAMTLTAAGRLGIGTTSPGYTLDVAGVGFFQGVEVGRNADSVRRNGDLYLVADNANNLIFQTNGVDRARIDSSGNLLVGQSSGGSGRLRVSGSGDAFNASYASPSAAYFWSSNSGDSNCVEIYQGRFNKVGLTMSNNNTGTVTQIDFVQTGTSRGSITTNNSTTSYNTSSDYRLKENIQPMTGALAKVAALKPVTYKWKVDGSDGEGFIAHELAEVVPHAVTGEKDAVDEDGNPKYQGIDTSFLVATLTAAIQELKAEFDAYKAAHP